MGYVTLKMYVGELVHPSTYVRIFILIRKLVERHRSCSEFSMSKMTDYEVVAIFGERCLDFRLLMITKSFFHSSVGHFRRLGSFVE